MRVASYNVGDLRGDPEAVARVVRAVDPDVLALQEVPRRLLGGQRVADLAAACGLLWSGGHRGSGGTTLLTSMRVDVGAVAHRRLPVRVPDRTRGYALARVALPGSAPVVVASVHLSLDGDERRRHARLVLDGAGDVAGEPGGSLPVLVAGDLNEPLDGPAGSLLGEGRVLASPRTPTYPARRPRTLLDVLLAPPGVAVLPHAEVDLDEGDVRVASDHRPVWADLGPVRRR